MHTVTITVTMKAKPDRLEEMRNVCVNLVALCQGEEGCRHYYIQQSQDDPSIFMLYMQWKNEASFEKHLLNPLVKQFDEEQASQLLAKPYRITRWKLVS